MNTRCFNADFLRQIPIAERIKPVQLNQVLSHRQYFLIIITFHENQCIYLVVDCQFRFRLFFKLSKLETIISTNQ